MPVYRPMQYVMNGHPLPMAPPGSAFPTAPGAWGRQVSTVSGAPTVPTEPLVSARPYPTGPVTPVSLQSMMAPSDLAAIATGESTWSEKLFFWSYAPVWFMKKKDMFQEKHVEQNSLSKVRTLHRLDYPRHRWHRVPNAPTSCELSG